MTKHTITRLFLALVALAAAASLLAAPVAASAKATPTPKPTAKAAQHKPKPKPKPAAKVLVPTMTGTASGETPAFKPTNSYVAKYKFDCSAQGESGNFAIMAEDGNGTPIMGGPSVNRLAMSGSGTAKGSGLGEPSSIHLQILSECAWTVTVTAS